jgi:hypothetical protein
MSFMHMDASTAAAEELYIVTLSGGTASDFDSNFAQAGYEFRSAGTVFRKTGFAFNQVNPLTDWIFPRTTFDGADFQIRAHQIPGGIFLTGASLDTWLTLDSNRLWQASCVRFCVEAGSFYVDIRWQDGTNLTINKQTSLHDGAPVMASALYNIYLEAN